MQKSCYIWPRRAWGEEVLMLKGLQVMPQGLGGRLSLGFLQLTKGYWVRPWRATSSSFLLFLVSILFPFSTLSLPW